MELSSAVEPELLKSISLFGALSQEALESLHPPFAEARAKPQREHFAQRVKAPGGAAEPVDATAEVAAQPVPEGRGQHGLAAAARAYECDARRSCGDDRAREGAQLGVTTFQSSRAWRKNRRARGFADGWFFQESAVVVVRRIMPAELQCLHAASCAADTPVNAVAA